jgi:hypothetical protein
MEASGHARCAQKANRALTKELAKLLPTAFIREVFHLEWLTNPVLICKKRTNEWRM